MGVCRSEGLRVTIEMSTLLAVGGPALAVGLWLVRLEGRVNVHESQLGDLRADVKYIRERIDDALNGHSHPKKLITSEEA